MGESYLITGEPGVGKTTAIKKIVAALGPERCGGFYTEELRNEEGRIGFQIVTLNGARGLLASVHSCSPLRIGRYGVDLEALESIGLEALREGLARHPVVIIDEIGPMELLSQPFKEAVEAVLAGPPMLVGSVVLRPCPWADELKQRPNVHLYELCLANREQLTGELITALQEKLAL